ncbi:MAG: DUF4412 domain-containing protein [Capsulimonas sp.]|uniref:DUF4412 domain-containing protein n=1 Tax=Capsulimonas sp. TaxID=2494211 RepID=UPI00326384B6
MQFRSNHFRSALIAVAGVSLLAPIARADQKIVAATSVDGPQLRTMMAQMSPEQKAAMGKYGMGTSMISTVYVSGKKVRADTNGSAVLMDPIAKTVTSLDRDSHTYTTRPFDPAAMKGASGVKASIVDAHDSKKLLGHTAHHYKMTITANSGSMAGTPIHGDVWVAADIAQTPTLPTAGPGAVLQAELRKIKGFPLLTVIAVPNSPTGPLTVTTTVKSISNAALPATTFKIPAGYKASAPGAGVGAPGMGMPGPM